MKIIIGLGNPGEKYSGTRHNIGFEILDRLKESLSFSDFEFNKKFNAEMTEGFYPPVIPSEAGGSRAKTEKSKILLVKPRAFVNLSGETVQKILEFYKLTPEDIFVVHDDLDIALGKYKIATDSGSAGHNGVQNIIEKLGTQKFKRVRIGIGKEVSDTISCRVDAHDYVLAKFSGEESEKIKKILDDILSVIKRLL